MTEQWRRETLAWLKARSASSTHLRIDSRDVTPGDVFVALKGEKTDAMRFATVAEAQGARAILCEPRLAGSMIPSTLEYLEVEHLRERLGAIASDFYGNPSDSLRGVAVTGTNGKTSISHWCAALLTALGEPCAAIGTIGTFLRGEELKAPALTTPDAASLQGLFYDLKSAGAKAFALEASSIGLVQGRMEHTALQTAIFTNLTRDHIDYHKSIEAYAAAKERLFTWPELRNAVINLDDAFGRTLAASCVQRGIRTIGYGFANKKEDSPCKELLLAQNVRSSHSGMAFDVLWAGKTHRLKARVLGEFNVYNLLAVASVALVSGFPAELVFEKLATLQPPAGRLQVVAGRAIPLAVVDYCHTPDAIEKALQALRPTARERGGRLWIVFGAGGDRDPGKRPMMGEVAARGADCQVITSDNPRSESPEAIAKAILEGFPAGMRPEVILDRRKAIVETLCRADERDVVLIAGKGHEDYQEICGVKHHLSDAETVREASNERFVRRNSR